MRLIVGIVMVCLAWEAVREIAADRAIAPLRRALVVQRQLRSESERETAEVLLREALPAGERAARLCPRDSDYARLVAHAYLHLSGGRRSPELEKAEGWLKQSLRLCPIDASVRDTLLELRRKRSSGAAAD